MLREEVVFNQTRVVIVMSDIAIITSSVKATLSEIKEQAAKLGIGLSNAAPGSVTGTPNNSIQYLLKTADFLSASIENCEKLLKTIKSDANNKPRI
jgi:hypothetical protein